MTLELNSGLGEELVLRGHHREPRKLLGPMQPPLPGLPSRHPRSRQRHKREAQNTQLEKPRPSQASALLRPRGLRQLCPSEPHEGNLKAANPTQASLRCSALRKGLHGQRRHFFSRLKNTTPQKPQGMNTTPQILGQPQRGKSTL